MNDFANGFRGTKMGSVQTTYADQPGQAVAGMLAFASDINLCDSMPVGETLGIAAGLGVVFEKSDDGLQFQRPPFQAVLPNGDETAAQLAGVLVFDEHMQSDEDGTPGWANGRMGRFLRPGRAGGRVYVVVKDNIDCDADTVYWVTAADSGGLRKVGEFCNSLLSGDDGTSVAIANAKWITDETASTSSPGLAMIEFYGTVVPVGVESN